MDKSAWCVGEPRLVESSRASWSSHVEILWTASWQLSVGHGCSVMDARRVGSEGIGSIRAEHLIVMVAWRRSEPSALGWWWQRHGMVEPSRTSVGAL